MNHKPLVSIVIPTYNRARLLPAAIESVLGQGYPNTEIIIVDDGSTDETQEVLSGFGNRINILTQENKGAAAARNHGIRSSKGDIVAFLDSDDLWLPTKLERQVALLEKTDRSVPCCLCNIQLAYSDGRVGSSFDLSLIRPSIEEGLWVNVLEVLATRFILFNQSVAIRREALEKVGGYDENYLYMEDHDLALRLALLGPWAFIQQPLVIWNEGTMGSLTKQSENEQVNLFKTIFDIYQKIVMLSKSTKCYESRHRQLVFELMRAWLKLKAASLSHMPSHGSRAVGLILKELERFFDKVYTNSPLYPKMEVTTIEYYEQSLDHTL
ncbi:MAG: glycosyltransferase family 2 protein [Methylobacter sp.]